MPLSALSREEHVGVTWRAQAWGAMQVWVTADYTWGGGQESRQTPGEAATPELLTCRKGLEIVTVLELPIFIQKVLWLKLLWIGEFLVVKQEGVQCWNYECALEE